MLLFKIAKTCVYQCACGHKYIDPSLDARSMMEIYRSSEQLKQINPALEHYYEYEILKPGTRTHRDYEQVLKETESAANGKELLEIGCGRGSFLKFARERGWEVSGVDSGPENIEALAREGISGVCSDFMEFRTDRKFDAIVLWDLIEHTENPKEFLRKAKQFLHRDGVFVLATPHDPNLLTQIAGFLYKISNGAIKAPLERLYILEHTSYFSGKTLRALLTAVQMEIVSLWKTETDLERYKFSFPLKFALKTAFFLARQVELQNRIIVIAREERLI